MSTALSANLVFNMQRGGTRFGYGLYRPRDIKGGGAKANIRIYQQRQRTNIRDAPDIG
ncbi:hypothetical protein LTSEALA_0541 [Salmonella enterica subsp. enterica serovar Alachua str. R6-377]|uniref:Uncharacterized protein n=1 Tax=Salmonella enterica subsp. enterica serovar Alachua str. R6-377 TaxID=913241 RepID=G5LJQ1_SALET|nr:hypothetical protein LTSEALA_0541 [Salmonella enterica subsp. enterica serovar Alachua str. R6-377]